jgi:hypothetical protein
MGTRLPVATGLPIGCHEGNNGLRNILSAARADEARGRAR